MELADPVTGDTIDEPVTVGTMVSLVLRLKQIGSSDTMLSTCSALISKLMTSPDFSKVNFGHLT